MICERCRFYRLVCRFGDNGCFDREWVYGMCWFYGPPIPIVENVRICPFFEDTKGNKLLELAIRLAGYLHFLAWQLGLALKSCIVTRDKLMCRDHLRNIAQVTGLVLDR